MCARRRAQAVEHQVDLAGDQVLQRRPRAAVRDVGDEGLRLQLEQLAREVVRGAIAGRGVVELAGVLAHQLEEALQVGRGDALRVDDDDLRHARDQADRDEIVLDRVVELGVHRGRDRVMHRAHEERVAVGRRLGGDAGADCAAGAAAVVDDHLASKRARQHGGQRPGKRVRAAPGRKGNDEGDRPRRPGALRPCQGADPGQG